LLAGGLELERKVVRDTAQPALASPAQVAVDEKQIEIDGEKKSLYAANGTQSKLTLEVAYSRPGTDLATVFLYCLTEKHNITETEFFVDAVGYLTAIARHEQSGPLDNYNRNHIEKCFQTVTMRIGLFHWFWRGSQVSVNGDCDWAV